MPDPKPETLWYYAENGQSVGPLEETLFMERVRGGQVTAETLVWHRGLTGWQAYGAVAGPHPAAASPEGRCHYCGRGFPPDALIAFQGVRVCAACKPVFVQQFKEHAELAPALGNRFAGFWIRVAAKLLDGVISYILIQMVNLPLTLSMGLGGRDPSMPKVFALLGLTMFLSFSIQFAYEVGFLTKFGATPGKMACGLKVIRSDGSPLTFGRAVGRYFGDMLSGMTFGIGYLLAAFDEAEHKTLHDHLCDTRVIHKNR